MIEKKREVFERAVGVLSKEITRIEKNRVKDSLDVNIIRCALMLETEDLKNDEREIMKKAFDQKYFKKILDDNKKTKNSKARRNRAK